MLFRSAVARTVDGDINPRLPADRCAPCACRPGRVKAGSTSRGRLVVAAQDVEIVRLAKEDRCDRARGTTRSTPAEREKDRDGAITFEYVNDFCSRMRSMLLSSS